MTCFITSSPELGDKLQMSIVRTSDNLHSISKNSFELFHFKLCRKLFQNNLNTFSYVLIHAVFAVYRGTVLLLLLYNIFFGKGQMPF